MTTFHFGTEQLVLYSCNPGLIMYLMIASGMKQAVIHKD